MPSSVNNPTRPQVRKAAVKPGAAARRAATQQQLNRRAARAAQRAAERRRRNTLLSVVAALLVVGLFILVFHDHLPGFSSGATASKVAYNCPAPTATPVGPQPAVTPDATPPALPADAKEQSQPISYTDASGASQQGTIKYAIVAQGCGPTTKTGDTVTVQYTGWLQSNGKMFDSSALHAPYSFQVSGIGSDTPSVIQGWNYGLIGMKPGETRRLTIPPSLGYGAQGSTNQSTGEVVIPPDATLIFDVKLISIDAHS